MNKYKEAKAWLDKINANPQWNKCDIEEPALSQLTELVGRATPKKPTKTTIDEPVLGECVYETYDAYKCPICGKMIAVDYYGLDYRDYCQFCGQAIDWSDK